MRIAAINGFLLSAVVWLFDISNIYADSSQRTSQIVLTSESCDKFAANGQQVYLDCSPCANKSGSTVDWWHQTKSNHFRKTVLISNGETNKQSGATMDFHLADDNVGLILNDVTVSNAGLYTCFCDGGFGDRKTTNLTVTDYVAVNVGRSATLDCYSSTPDVEWSYNKYGVRSSTIYSDGFVYDEFIERFRLPRLPTWNFTLVIDGLQFNDSGNYTCHEDGGTSSNQHTFRLITSVRAADGQSEISLPCPQSVGDVVWKVQPIQFVGVFSSFGSETIYACGQLSKNFRDRFSLGPSNGTLNNYTLTIKNIQSRDAGIYACFREEGLDGINVYDGYFTQLVISNETDDVQENNTPPVTEPGSSKCNNSNQTTVCHCARGEWTVIVYVPTALLVITAVAIVILVVIIVRNNRSRDVTRAKTQNSAEGTETINMMNSHHDD